MVITDTLSPLVQATFLKAHLKLVAVGMTPPRGVRKGDLLKKAGIITGKTYKRGQYMEAAENGVVDIDPIAEEIFGDDYFYTGGWDNIRVAWLPVGTKFRIEEYDGSEHIECADDIEWSVA